MDTADKILEIEWEMFSTTENEGGRASCQENKPQFEVMRRAQFSAWDEETLESYLADIESAREQGRNLMTEKYGYMMESTAPEQYAEIKRLLPQPTEQGRALAEALVAQTVKWAEEFHEKYPKVAACGRPLYKSSDGPYATSIETYNLGEALTYSERTMCLLLARYARAAEKGENLYTAILEKTASLSGYASLDDAEAAL